MTSIVATPQDQLGPKHREFLLLTIFVLTQHGLVERAKVLTDALIACGDSSSDVRLAEAVLTFFVGEHRETLHILEILDQIDPMERFGPQQLNERQRMRRYLRAKCLHELKNDAEATQAIEIYLRRGAREISTRTGGS